METSAQARGGTPPLGEIVEASTTNFRAVASETFAPPAFGSFVRTTDGDITVYGVVAHVEHASVDPSRRAIPLGRTWEELEREQPQVRELLTTEFQAICVAYAQGVRGSSSADALRSPGSMGDGSIHHYLPPAPPRVHDFVEPALGAEILDLTADLSFVRTLGGCGLPVAGELVAASVRLAATHHADPKAFLVRAGREVADLYRQDYEQACSILRRFGIDVPQTARSRSPR